MLVLFIYVASLASNEFFVFSIFWIVIFIIIIVISISIFMVDPIILALKVNVIGSEVIERSNVLRLIYKIYRIPVMGFTLYVVVYLLLTLLVVVKIIGRRSGPLRLKIYDNSYT